MGRHGNINANSSWKAIPLNWRDKYGYKSVAKLLIEKGCSLHNPLPPEVWEHILSFVVLSEVTLLSMRQFNKVFI